MNNQDKKELNNRLLGRYLARELSIEELSDVAAAASNRWATFEEQGSTVWDS